MQVLNAPKYGWIQRQRIINDGEEEWQNVEHFTSQQLAMGQIRYIHNQETPSQDMFKVLSVIIYDTVQTLE